MEEFDLIRPVGNGLTVQGEREKVIGKREKEE
jgi:hypothetical protein